MLNIDEYVARTVGRREALMLVQEWEKPLWKVCKASLSPIVSIDRRKIPTHPKCVSIQSWVILGGWALGGEGPPSNSRPAGAHRRGCGRGRGTPHWFSRQWLQDEAESAREYVGFWCCLKDGNVGNSHRRVSFGPFFSVTGWERSFQTNSWVQPKRGESLSHGGRRAQHLADGFMGSTKQEHCLTLALVAILQILTGDYSLCHTLILALDTVVNKTKTRQKYSWWPIFDTIFW